MTWKARIEFKILILLRIPRKNLAVKEKSATGIDRAHLLPFKPQGHPTHWRALWPCVWISTHKLWPWQISPWVHAQVAPSTFSRTHEDGVCMGHGSSFVVIWARNSEVSGSRVRSGNGASLVLWIPFPGRRDRAKASKVSLGRQGSFFKCLGVAPLGSAKIVFM